MLSVKEISATDFDEYVGKKHPEANFLQSSAWGEVYRIDGEKIFFLGLFDGKKQLGATLAILKLAKRGAYLEIPGGPLTDWRKEEYVKVFLDGIAEIARNNKCVFVRMRPNIPDNEENRALAKKLGLVPSPMHLHAEHTVMIDLAKTEDELMSDMRRQTRYEVRKADKLGVKVKYQTDEDAFNDFYDLQLETAKRQGFIPSSREFILAQHKAFGENARIYTAKLHDQVLAKGLIIMQSPEAVYNEAASTEEGRKLPGAYALQWQVMRDAKQLGIKRYNLFGIAPPNSPHHRYAGVTTFKTGFGGELVTYLPAQDLVIKPIHYKFVHKLEELRKRRRHL